MADKTKPIGKGSNPLPGAAAAMMARGIPQHKAMAMAGLDSTASRVANVKK